jgi:hypothetical protein
MGVSSDVGLGTILGMDMVLRIQCVRNGVDSADHMPAK